MIVLSKDLPLEVELAGDLVTLLGAVQLPQPGALGNILQDRGRGMRTNIFLMQSHLSVWVSVNCRPVKIVDNCTFFVLLLALVCFITTTEAPSCLEQVPSLKSIFIFTRTVERITLNKVKIRSDLI